MKNLNLKLAGVFAFTLLSISAFSQTNWRKGGNNSLPAGSQPIIGTDATWNAPLLFHTNGVNSFATYTVQSCQNTPPKTLPLAH